MRTNQVTHHTQGAKVHKERTLRELKVYCFKLTLIVLYSIQGKYAQEKCTILINVLYANNTLDLLENVIA